MREILTSAEASASGRPLMCAPRLSAAYSRVRLIAILNNHGGERRQDKHEYRADDAETAIAVAIAASEEHGKLRKHGNGASNGGGYRHCQRVVITHMA